MEQNMIDKILDSEIEEILREKPRELISLTEIVDRLGENRKKKDIDPISKTTIYTKLMKMVSQRKLLHLNRKGFKLINYEFTDKDPNFGLFETYKRINDAVANIWVDKGGKIQELWEELSDDVDQDDWNELKNNYKKLIEQGILETKHYYKDAGYLLSVSYYWALYHDICPICLETIDLTKPHFALEFTEGEFSYIQLVKTHIRCIEQLLNRYYELKKEYDRGDEPPKYDPYEDSKFEDYPNVNIGFICPYCGLTTDLYDLFLNEDGFLNNIYSKFGNGSSNQNGILLLLQNLSRELFGEVATLIWAKKIEFKKNVRLVIRKIVIINGVTYHPNCGIRMKEDPYYSKKVNGEIIANETTK